MNELLGYLNGCAWWCALCVHSLLVILEELAFLERKAITNDISLAMNPFLQTLLLLVKVVAKVSYLVLMAFRNFVLVVLEVFVALIPTAEKPITKQMKMPSVWITLLFLLLGVYVCTFIFSIATLIFALQTMKTFSIQLTVKASISVYLPRWFCTVHSSWIFIVYSIIVFRLMLFIPKRATALLDFSFHALVSAKCMTPLESLVED